MRCIDASTYNPERPGRSIDIAEPGDEPVAHPAPEARILVVENPPVSGLFGAIFGRASDDGRIVERPCRDDGWLQREMMGSATRGYHLTQLACSAPSALPGTTVYVMVGDMGLTATMDGDALLDPRMMLRAVPVRVASGQVSFVVGNMGWRTHELVLLPLGPGQNAGDRVPGADGQVDETGSLDEASASCAAGSGEGIKSGTVGWVTLHLPAGRYELLCNLRNQYANGMRQLLVVT
jgi:uncharacterized cupredoxin-like copper-binding protein